MEHTKNNECRHCGKLLADGVRTDKVFCSVKCKAAYHRGKGEKVHTHEALHTTQKHTCEVCGGEFAVNPYARRKGEREAKYCSPKCRQKAYRQRHKSSDTPSQ